MTVQLLSKFDALQSHPLFPCQNPLSRIPNVFYKIHFIFFTLFVILHFYQSKIFKWQVFTHTFFLFSSLYIYVHISIVFASIFSPSEYIVTFIYERGKKRKYFLIRIMFYLFFLYLLRYIHIVRSAFFCNDKFYIQIILRDNKLKRK